jgi:adenylosuccinate synthase
LRAGEIFAEDFQEKYDAAKKRSIALIEHYKFEDYDLEQMENEFFAAVDRMRAYQFVNSEYLINRFIKEGKKILAEGAQGSMLDVDFGSYPYVTSSNTTAGGVCTGLGIAPRHINNVIGIFKAYCTRVGGGPFPTELDDEVGQELRDKGQEYGATTGRPRRCGWIDLVALKYAIMLSGVNKLCMMKGDVLSGFEEVKAGVSYRSKGEDTDEVCFHYDKDLQTNYVSNAGWAEDITGITEFEKLPLTVKDYIAYLEKELETDINVISVGPGRTQTIERD